MHDRMSRGAAPAAPAHAVVPADALHDFERDTEAIRHLIEQVREADAAHWPAARARLDEALKRAASSRDRAHAAAQRKHGIRH
jgi:hypothetical protein